MNSLDLNLLKEWQKNAKDFMLIDVRETFEHDYFNIGGLNIPLGDILKHTSQLPKEKDIVIYCAKGIRSVIAIQKLESKGYTHLYNLSGGLGAILPHRDL